MNIVVKTGDELNLSRAGAGFMGNLLNDSEVSFHLVEEEGDLSKADITPRRKLAITNFSQVMGGMSYMNLSGAASPVVVETSLVVNGLAMKEEINPLEKPDVKLAFTSTKNMIIGILIVACFVINGAMVGPLTLYLPAKSPLTKALWRTQTNF